MLRAVRDLRDIPELFVVDEGEKKMVGLRKTTPERLDKIIQFIWDYQDKHGGDTPNIETIGRHVGISGQGTGYFINMLVDTGRLSKISSRPFRATIVDHPKNAAAIKRFQRIRERIEQEEAAERERIRAEQVETSQNEQRDQDKAALFEATTVTQSRSESAPPRPFADRTSGNDVVERLEQAAGHLRSVQREARAAMPQLLKAAESRDLVYELITRGYTVSKA